METLQSSSVREQLLFRKNKLDEALNNVPENSELVGLLRQVDSALERLDQGSYGICEVCYDRVEEERLLVDPLITVCLGCLDDAQKRALENDLEFASAIQRNLLPKNNQSIGGWEFSYHYNPAGPVSGDFTNIIPLPDDSVIFLIGDVSGKGVSASLMMSHLYGLIHSLLSFGLPVNEILNKVNRLFCESTLLSNYATMALGKADVGGNIEISIAGHNPPLIHNSNGIQKIDATGVPVGLFCESNYTSRNFKLNNGDSLLLYTDGLTESSFDNIEYGENRVIEQLVLSAGRGAKDSIENLILDYKNYLRNEKPADDLTILSVKRIR